MATDGPFDPAAWIEQFQAVGGGFIDTSDTLHFFWVIEHRPLTDNIEARLLYNQAKSDPAKIEAVRQHIVRNSFAVANHTSRGEIG